MEESSQGRGADPWPRQIILFGSCATGDDDINSDIDLFILADEPEAVRSQFSKIDLERELRPVIVSPMEMSLMETNDKVFLNEIRKGIVLWENGVTSYIN